MKFVDFISRLAGKYSVQLFVTTHSKECVDAFLKLKDMHSLMAYRLEKKDGQYIARQSPGEELELLVDRFDFDIR